MTKYAPQAQQMEALAKVLSRAPKTDAVLLSAFLAVDCEPFREGEGFCVCVEALPGDDAGGPAVLRWEVRTMTGKEEGGETMDPDLVWVDIHNKAADLLAGEVVEKARAERVAQAEREG